MQKFQTPLTIVSPCLITLVQAMVIGKARARHYAYMSLESERLLQQHSPHPKPKPIWIPDPKPGIKILIPSPKPEAMNQYNPNIPPV